MNWVTAGPTSKSSSPNTNPETAVTQQQRANRIRDPFDHGFNTIYTPRTARGTHIPPAIITAMKTDGARIREHAVNTDGNIATDQPGSRHFRQRQKLLIRLRDNTCQHTGCRRPARNCHNDHIQPYEHDGPTLIRNAQTLCALHHRWKHHTANQHTANQHSKPSPHRPTIFDDSPLLVRLE